MATNHAPTPAHPYDLIFSLGEACSCTQALRAADLQCFSYPFDWLFGSDFAGRAQLVLTEFAGFLRREDLCFSYEERSIKCNAYYNNSTGITFNHDFYKGRDFDEMFDEVAAKYQRRIARLLAQISRARRVLAVFIELPNRAATPENDEILRQMLSEFDTKFGKKFEFLYFSCDAGFAAGEFERREISPRITKIVGNYAKFSEPQAAQAYVVSEAFFARALAGLTLAPQQRLRARLLAGKRLFLRCIFRLFPRSWRMVLANKYLWN